MVTDDEFYHIFHNITELFIEEEVTHTTVIYCYYEEEACE
jgi:hypothetical protein